MPRKPRIYLSDIAALVVSCGNNRNSGFFSKTLGASNRRCWSMDWALAGGTGIPRTGFGLTPWPCLLD
jgi:hypothetical protein